MKNRVMHIMFLWAALLWLAGCTNSSFYHANFMTGQVVEASLSNVVLCIGERAGAESGQQLNVYRAVFRTDVVEEGESHWQRELVGQVKVESIINEHFAKARVIEGDVSKYDIVELSEE